jgi:lysophospholipase L1-like esterase
MNFYFFGDSICFGQFISPNRTWVNKVTEKLEKIFPRLIVQNPSVNGRTTRQALEDMHYQLEVQNPNLVYVQFGMNDCNYWVTNNGAPRVSIAAFEANLTEIILRARLAGAWQVFLATNHPSSRTSPYSSIPGLTISYQDSNAYYNKAIRKVAGEQKVLLIDNEAHWLDSKLNQNEIIEKLLLPDGIHLSEKGHMVYSEFTGTQLEAFINKIIIGELSKSG